MTITAIEQVSVEVAMDMVDGISATRAERCVAPDVPSARRPKYNSPLVRLRTFGGAPPISSSERAELKTELIVPPM
jgi:hypothetical protein